MHFLISAIRWRYYTWNTVFVPHAGLPSLSTWHKWKALKYEKSERFQESSARCLLLLYMRFFFSLTTNKKTCHYEEITQHSVLMFFWIKYINILNLLLKKKKTPKKTIHCTWILNVHRINNVSRKITGSWVDLLRAALNIKHQSKVMYVRERGLASGEVIWTWVKCMFDWECCLYLDRWWIWRSHHLLLCFTYIDVVWHLNSK